jgi:hypothetical protein
MSNYGYTLKLIINGKLQSENEKIKIPLDQEIDVMKELNASDLKSKYNIDNEEGEVYYEINTKKEVPKKEESTGWGVRYQEETIRPKSLIEEITKDTELNSTEINIKKTLIILDEKEISYSELKKINPNKISSLHVFPKSKDIIEKFGSKAKHGVILIESNENNKKNNPNQINLKVEKNRVLELSNIKKSDKKDFAFNLSYTESKPTDQIANIKKSKNVDVKKALIIYNGKEINYEELDNIDPKSIVSSSVMTATKYALDKYGDKAKNGLIELKTIKFLEATDPEYVKMINEIKKNTPKDIKVE